MWNDGRDEFEGDPDDVEFINQLAAHLIDEGIADPKRLYLLGLSSGGMLTYRIACKTPHRFSAYAAVTANMPKNLMAGCKPDIGVPLIIINSRHDRDNENEIKTEDKFKRNPEEVISSDATVSFWQRINSCTPTPQKRTMPDLDLKDGSAIVAKQYKNCTSGAPLVSFMVEKQGHALSKPVKKNQSVKMSILGKTNGDISVADISWKFFRRFAAQ
jgi:polyhydroxybutyrate depolymerase